MTPANLSGVKDAYYMARRYQDTIDAVVRMPEGAAVAGFVGHPRRQLRAARQDRGGRRDQGQAAAAFPNVSAERMVNEDYAYARKEDEDFFVDGFRVAGLPVCMTAEEIAQFPALKPRPECEAERAKAETAKS